MPAVGGSGWDKVDDYGSVVDHVKDAGGNTINLVKMSASQDITSVLASLSQGKCLCPHWGYLLGGRITVGYDDGSEEVVEAGDAFYMRAGHTSWRADAGTEFVQFSPSDLLAETDAAIAEALQRVQPDAAR